MADASMLQGRKLLITGATGTVGRPLIEALSPLTTLYAMSRFDSPADRIWAERAGARPITADLAEPASLGAIPDDVDYVVNLAVARTDEWRRDFAVNAEGVGHLMARCRNAGAFLHFSTSGVYQHRKGATYKETDPLGDNHRVQLETYSLSKIAGEQVCRFAAHHFGIATTIARLNVPYGRNGGFPAWHLASLRAGRPIALHAERPNLFNPIHTDDIVAKIPLLLANASANEVTVTNLGGSDPVSVEDWSRHMGDVLGVEPVFVFDEHAFASVEIDTTRMHELVGRTSVDWRYGMQDLALAVTMDTAR